MIGGPVTEPRGEAGGFYVEVDFTSPNSFKLDVIVFDSHRDLERWLSNLRAARARFVKQCRSDPICRNSFEASGGTPKLPVQRVVGPVDYSAATDSPEGKLPLRTFERLVALASGTKRAG